MRKTVYLLIGLVLIFLAACGANEDLSKEEVLSQTIEKVETIESYSADIKMDTSMLGMDMSIEGVSDITHNPDTMYIKMTMNMPGMAMETETYYADGVGYMSMFDEWFEMSEEELQLGSFDQLNKEELEKLQAFEDQFEMTEEDGMYVLSLTGDGETFKKLVDPYLDSSMGGNGGEILFDEELDFSVNNFETKMWIDKKTMILTTQTVLADIEMDGEAFTISSEVSISNIDEVEPIEVPAEVLENVVADDYWEDDYDYEEEDLTLDEINEIIDFTIPTITHVPEGYELVDTYYDEYSGAVFISYEKDFYNYFTVDVYPSKEAYGEIYMEETTEEIDINGETGILQFSEGNFMYMTWMHGDLFIDLTVDGPEMSKDILLDIANGIE
ncbi:DUF6612 family protein [Oceanobacillus sp. CAU 1775]